MVGKGSAVASEISAIQLSSKTTGVWLSVSLFLKKAKVTTRSALLMDSRSLHSAGLQRVSMGMAVHPAAAAPANSCKNARLFGSRIATRFGMLGCDRSQFAV
ncbi:hypothetical protein SC09_Contig19orf00299 [Bacillus subtilis]|uniref:Uncharacterized protein n=1 Tax=Bacillus subtilis TaxID=1423 RepID=A0A0D1JHH5_BACIU|nr:hypothetical protein SC09_Contig19orf00299 [Bacillus subtilis]